MWLEGGNRQSKMQWKQEGTIPIMNRSTHTVANGLSSGKTVQDWAERDGPWEIPAGISSVLGMNTTCVYLLNTNR